MYVLNVEQEEHAKRVALLVIGQRPTEIPLEIISVDEIPEADTDDDTTDLSDA